MPLASSGSEAFRGSFFGGGAGPIFLEQYDCNDGHRRLLDCAVRPVGVHTCDHSRDAGVRCIGKVLSKCILCTLIVCHFCLDFNECVINNGGCEQLCYNQVASFECGCFDGYILQSNGINCSGKTSLSLPTLR